VPADGGEPRKLDLAMDEIGAFDVSPDGRRIAFTGTRRDPEVWVIKNLLTAVRAAR
jgi:hypothetical protein